MLPGIYRLFITLTFFIAFYVVDIGLTSHYGLLGKHKGSKNWRFMILSIATAAFIIAQRVACPQLSMRIEAWWGLLIKSIGVLLLTGGLILCWWARMHLGSFATFLTIPFREKKQLIKERPGYAEYISRTPRFLPKLHRSEKQQQGQNSKEKTRPSRTVTVKRDLYQTVHDLLKDIGPGKMVSTSYDTAWVARLIELDKPMGKQALDWLRTHQLADGSWGAAEPKYYHDRVICTLAAMIALARYGQPQDYGRLLQAQSMLKTLVKGLRRDPAGATVGFEMIIPTLIEEAKKTGINLSQVPQDPLLQGMIRARTAKLQALSGQKIDRSVTLAFSAEMVGTDGWHILDIENLKEPNNSVGHSPSATTYLVLRNNCENAAVKYLNEITVDNDGGVPNVAPFDVFERGWTLWNLALTGCLDSEAVALCQPHLDFLQAAWNPGQGVGFATGYTPNDADDTGLVCEVLSRFGRQVDLDGVMYYEEKEHFRCYELEANPSVSANIHVLGALQAKGFGKQQQPVKKIMEFLYRMRTGRLFWCDKWHSSPYYPTSHAIIALINYNDDALANEMISDALYWIQKTQNLDGSWGFYSIPTAEETAYALQALAVSKLHGKNVSVDALKRGIAWLEDHAEPPYPPLWIGKCLYCPVMVVRSAVLSAMILVEHLGERR